MEFTRVTVKRTESVKGTLTKAMASPVDDPPVADKPQSSGRTLSRLSAEFEKQTDVEFRKHEMSLRRHIQNILKSQTDITVVATAAAAAVDEKQAAEDDLNAEEQDEAAEIQLQEDQIKFTLNSILSKYLDSNHNSPRESLDESEHKLPTIPQDSELQSSPMSNDIPDISLAIEHKETISQPTSPKPTESVNSESSESSVAPSLQLDDSTMEDSSILKGTDDTSAFFASFGNIEVNTENDESWKLDESLNDAEPHGMNRRRAIAHSGRDSDTEETPLPHNFAEISANKLSTAKRIITAKSADVSIKPKTSAAKQPEEKKHASKGSVNNEIAVLVRRSLQLCLSNSKLADLLPESLYLTFKGKKCLVESVCQSQCARIRKVYNVSSQMLLESVKDMHGGLSGGRSGSFFFATTDKQFIVKSMSVEELDFMEKSFVHEYTSYISRSKNTLLPKFFAVIKIHSGTATFKFLVMNNVFNTTLPMREVYDLKGSKLNRVASKKERAKGERAVLKDVDFLNAKRRLWLPRNSILLFCHQLASDCRFLASKGIMDYSLLVGIHYLEEDGTESTLPKDEETVTTSSIRASTKGGGTRKPHQSVFQGEFGGIMARTYDGQKLNEVYYIGIIDILQQYTWKKEFETILKSISHEKSEISSMEVDQYKDRFLRFVVESVIQTNPKATAESIAMINDSIVSNETK
jgi:hypothetical protein